MTVLNTTSGADSVREAAPADAWGRVAHVNRKVLFELLRNASACADARRFEAALDWCFAAAGFASDIGWSGDLASPELERQLLRAAAVIPAPSATRTRAARPRWLHVLSQAYETLGHSNLCRRWIAYDSEGTQHDVMLLRQNGPPPANLVEAVKQSRGECVVLDPEAPFLERARQLRDYAWHNSDVVVLHTHPSEVVAVVAFGVPGGPPVLLGNHADHVFWAGGSVADLVVDIRESGHQWTTRFRGIDRAVILPPPLWESPGQSSPAAVISGEDRSALRRTLGLPSAGIMFLTVGSESKYRPACGVDFVATAQALVQRCPGTFLVAVGPGDHGPWRAARSATQGRVMAVGQQPDAARYYKSADIYLEGFPLGSLMAALEAGQHGLALVRNPKTTPSPYTCDGVAFEPVAQPVDVNDYLDRAVAMAGSPRMRQETGSAFHAAVQANYLGKGWLDRLADLKRRIPSTHTLHANAPPIPVPDHVRDWWLAYQHGSLRADTVECVVERALVDAVKATGAKATVSLALWEDIQSFRALFAAPLRASGAPASCPTRSALPRWNRRVLSLGQRKRLIAAALSAHKKGEFLRACIPLYRCIGWGPGCFTDRDWLKAIAKTHFPRRWLHALFRRPAPGFQPPPIRGERRPA